LHGKDRVCDVGQQHRLEVRYSRPGGSRAEGQ